LSKLYDRDVHHRRSIRLGGYNYAQAGVYFVTICTFHRECLFGDIRDGKMQLNQYGRIVEGEWLWTAFLRPEIILDLYAVMPNHIHGIVIKNDVEDTLVGATRRVAPSSDTTPHPNGPTSGSIGAIIGQFKSVVTKQINVLRQSPGARVWQRNYYERIVRDDDELNKVRDYIENNPLNWTDDENNPFDRTPQP
jgi:putative transposase